MERVTFPNLAIRRGGEEYDRLAEAMNHYRPACRGYDLFTADDPDAAQLALARRLCAGCPLRGLCSDFAEAANPEAGIWAGTRYPKRKRTV